MDDKLITYYLLVCDNNKEFNKPWSCNYFVFLSNMYAMNLFESSDYSPLCNKRIAYFAVPEMV